MLYITFNIIDALKFKDFQELYKHMLNMRQPGYKFPDDSPEIDWDSKHTQEEIDEAVKKLNDYLDVEPEVHRFRALIPDYAKAHLQKYVDTDNEKLKVIGVQNVVSIFNYLEYGFEVDFDSLEKTSEHCAVIKFYTANYPFGGIERFLITLKAFELTPIECFDGFAISKIEWTNSLEYETTELKEKTKAYLQQSLLKSNTPIMELLSHFLNSEKTLYLAAGIIGIISVIAGLLFLIWSNHKSFAITMIFIGVLEIVAMFPAYLKHHQKTDDKISVYENNASDFRESEIKNSKKALKSFFRLKLAYALLIVLLILSMSFLSTGSILFGIFTALIIHLAFAITIDNFGEKYTKTYLTELEILIS